MLTTVVLLSVVAVIWVFFQFRQRQSTMQIPLPDVAAKAIMTLSEVRQTATKDGVMQWELEADGAELEAKTGRMVLQSPQVNFFLDDGSQVHLIAQQGILYTQTNNIEVKGHVQVRSDRYTLTTEALAYQHDHRILHASAQIKIVGQAFDLTAATMTYDLNSNQAHFNGQVKGFVHDISAL